MGVTDHNLWGEIRVFLRYLLEFEIVGSDYSTIVPHYSKPYVMPSVYPVEEIKRIEEAVDTSTVLGKRDYAMILLASRMGMRSGDIVALPHQHRPINFLHSSMGRWNKMSEYRSVFRDEIRTHLPIREAELSSEAYRHYKRTITLFDEYLCRINHAEKGIAEPVIEGWIKEASAGISVNTASLHVHYIRQLLLYLTGCGYPCFIPRTIRARDTYVPYLYSDKGIEEIFKAADSLTAPQAAKNIFIEKEMPLIAPALLLRPACWRNNKYQSWRCGF